jgi:hypothetical protein
VALPGAVLALDLTKTPIADRSRPFDRISHPQIPLTRQNERKVWAGRGNGAGVEEAQILPAFKVSIQGCHARCSVGSPQAAGSGAAVAASPRPSSVPSCAISEHFIESSRAKLQQMMERRLEKLKLCALLIDATPFAGQQMVAALGISQDGRKTILGLRQGATENTTVVGELLGDLLNRGLDFSQPRLYVLDGGKALHAAVKKYAGESAPIQRCQVHKRRNVLDHLTDEQKPAVAKKLNAAYTLEDYAAAQRALTQLHRELMDLN